MNAGSDWPSSRTLVYAKTVAEAMNLKLDMDNPADRERVHRAILDLVAGENAKAKTAWLKFPRSLSIITVWWSE